MPERVSETSHAENGLESGEEINQPVPGFDHPLIRTKAQRNRLDVIIAANGCSPQEAVRLMLDEDNTRPQDELVG